MKGTHKCERCERAGCHGECENYILDMVEHEADRDEFECLFKEIPKFNYVRDQKINAIFGTDLEVASKSSLAEKETEEWNSFLYSTNSNGYTNLYELKKALKERETFGEAYLFFDKKNFYSLTKWQVAAYQIDDKDPILNQIEYYTVGEVEIPDTLEFEDDGFIKYDEGYIISPENMITFKSDSYAMNSDLRQLQILIEINRKIYESTTKRDYGDLFLFTDAPQKNIVSAIAQRVKNTANEAIEKMRKHVAKLIKKNKVDDSNIVVLDESYKDVKQVEPVTKVTDYQFIWDNQDDIVTSVFSFPMILAGLGDEAGNVSKEELLKDARANTLTPLKADIANALSKIAKMLFGEECYLRFQDYSEVSSGFKEDNENQK